MKNILSILIFFKGQEIKIISTCIFIFINTITTVLIPYLIAVAIDKYIKIGDVSSLDNFLLIILLVAIFASVSIFFQTRLTGSVSLNALVKIRSSLFQKINFLEQLEFNKEQSGDLNSRLNNDTEKISSFLSESLLRFINTFFELIGVLIIIFILNYKLAIILVSTAIILVTVNTILSKVTKDLNLKYSASNGELSSDLIDKLINFKAIYAFGEQKFMDKYLTKEFLKNKTLALQSSFINGIYTPLYTFGGLISQIFVILYGLYLISQYELSIGLLIGFIEYARRFYQPLSFLGTIYGSFQSALASWTRVEQILKK
jgi:ATP-binding cassette, subfamily B, bacterial